MSDCFYLYTECKQDLQSRIDVGHGVERSGDNTEGESSSPPNKRAKKATKKVLALACATTDDGAPREVLKRALKEKKKNTDPKVKKVAQSTAMEAMSKAILAKCTEESATLKVIELEETVKSRENRIEKLQKQVEELEDELKDKRGALEAKKNHRYTLRSVGGYAHQLLVTAHLQVLSAHL